METCRASHRSQGGLKRSWLLLKPQLKTISDLSSYLLRVFDLQDACLKAFLSSVEKKGGMLSDVGKVVDGVDPVEEEIMDKQPVHGGVKLPENEEFEKETGGYQSESEVYKNGALKEGKSKEVEDTANLEETKRVSRKRKRLMRQLRSNFLAEKMHGWNEGEKMNEWKCRKV